MKKNVKILLIVCIMIVIVMFIILFINHNQNYNQHDYNPRDSHIGDSILNTMDKYKIYDQIAIPQSCDAPIGEVSKLKIQSNYVFIIEKCDSLVGKDYLWKALVNYYQLDQAQKYMPNTYILYNAEDLKRFQKEYDPNKLYILKKNVQRQHGLKIVNTYQEVIKNVNNYVVVQELQQNPYLIDGRKINLRIYMLVVCNNHHMNVYVYQNGFMYYTKEPFVTNSLEFGPNVTTGYIDRYVYQINPLTHDDFREYLDRHDRNLNQFEKNIVSNNQKISDYVFNNIYELLKNVSMAYTKKLCHSYKLNSITSFQLFGADVAIDQNLNATLMEINKGPDMDAKDERDKMVKINCIEDMFRILKLIPTSNQDNRFIRII